MTDPVLTWAQILSDNGDPANKPYPHDTGIYPFGINGYSWELGGDEYLGDPTRLPPATWSGMTAWFIIYQEAVTRGGAAKPTVACNVSIRKFQSWVHKKSGGWAQVQSAPPDNVVSARLTPNQASGGNATVTRNSDGSSSWPSPGKGFINHGWPNSRGSFTAGTVDGCFSYFEMKVDQPNANYIAASGIDWWTSPSAAGNTGYSQSVWRRLTTDWLIITGCSLDLAILQKDPPPPLAGIVGTPADPPPVITPPPVIIATLNGVPIHGTLSITIP